MTALTEKQREIVQLTVEALSEGSRWTKHHTAIDRKGNPVSEKVPDACAWCALGYIYKFSEYEEDVNAIERSFFDLHDVTIARVNDDSGRIKVRAALRKLLEIVV